MQATNLLVSNLSITEDEYIYKGQFTLSAEGKSTTMDLTELDSPSRLEEIKVLFSLEESVDIIRKELFSMVMEKSSISSRIKEGKDYLDSSAEKKDMKISGSLDLA